MSVSLLPDSPSLTEAALPAPDRQGGVASPFGWMYAEADHPAVQRRDDVPLRLVVPEPAPAPAETAGAADPPAAPRAAVDTVLLQPVESSPETLLTAMSLLQAGLVDANIDPASVNLRASENLEWSPFGSYYDRQIEVRLPDGQWFKLSADLAARSPQVAVWDIQRALGLSF